MWKTCKTIIKEQPDVISINRNHIILPTLWAARLVYPWLKKKPEMVAVFHNSNGQYYPGLNKFAGFIATSRHSGDAFVRKNPGIERLTEIIHCGTRLPTVNEAEKNNRDRPRRYFLNRGFPIIAMAGEMGKNQEELVDALPAMLEAFPDMTLAFFGDRGDRTSLKERISRLGLQKSIVFIGRIPRALLPDVVHDLDLSVSTHRNEGFGIVHIESMASYTPVVAYNSGGLVEIIRKGGGVLVNGGVKEFAHAVVDLLSDDEKRFRLGVEGRKVVEEHFSVDTFGKTHLRFYEKILAKKS
jgi:glycosyltransferase involved in cell wall biosynthesis